MLCIGSTLTALAPGSLIASNNQVDIDSVVRLGNGQKVIGYTYVDDRRRTVYFDPEIKSLAAALAKALPQQPVISLVNASADGSKLLILAYGDTDPGSFYVYDKASRHLDEIAPVRVALLGKQLAPVAIHHVSCRGWRKCSRLPDTPSRGHR